MEFKAKYINHNINENGEVSLNFALQGEKRLERTETLNQLLFKITSHNKPLKIAIDVAREKRSLDANAYFHVLVDKIAEKLGISTEEIKVRLVIAYGELAKDENGDYICLKLPNTVNVENYYKYAEYIGEEMDSIGKIWNKYLVYKETHTLDSKEMSRLLNGTIDEAKELGIDTRTPDEIAKMISLMEAKK
jgi:DNA-directed RNA polymerase delta subunit